MGRAEAVAQAAAAVATAAEEEVVAARGAVEAGAPECYYLTEP